MASGNCCIVNEDSNPATVDSAYRKALSYSRNNLFYLRSSIQHLNGFRNLGFRPEWVQTGFDILKEEIQRIETAAIQSREIKHPAPGTEVWAFLFAGHMLDRPEAPKRLAGHMLDRSGAPKRFPPDRQDAARWRIASALDQGEADANDYAFLSGMACGGELIFIEECLKRNVTVYVHMPCAEADYIRKHVSFGGKEWTDRFYRCRNDERVKLFYQTERVDRPQDQADQYQRNLCWTLNVSLVPEMHHLRFIALWDGEEQTMPEPALDGWFIRRQMKCIRQKWARRLSENYDSRGLGAGEEMSIWLLTGHCLR